MVLISLPTILIAAYGMERTIDTADIGLSQWIYQRALKKWVTVTGSWSSFRPMAPLKNRGSAPVLPDEVAPAAVPLEPGKSPEVDTKY